MHTIYFTRHGETVWNVENKICGMTDSPLTARGQQQARQLGALVRDSGLHIDEILYSPLSRAADTAKAIAAATGLPARCEPRLREQCFGKYEGTPRNGGEFRVSKTHFADRYDGGESMMQLAQRIYNLLDELRQDENKTYLLVAHNGIARVVESYFHAAANASLHFICCIFSIPHTHFQSFHLLLICRYTLICDAVCSLTAFHLNFPYPLFLLKLSQYSIQSRRPDLYPSTGYLLYIICHIYPTHRAF